MLLNFKLSNTFIWFLISECGFLFNVSVLNIFHRLALLTISAFVKSVVLVTITSCGFSRQNQYNKSLLTGDCGILNIKILPVEKLYIAIK